RRFGHLQHDSYLSFSDGGNAGTATLNLSGYGASFSGGPSAVSSAGSATFNNSGTISFRKLSNAGEATFINYGGDSFGAPGAEIDFPRSNADSSTIILYGGSVFGALGARLSFTRSSASLQRQLPMEALVAPALERVFFSRTRAAALPGWKSLGTAISISAAGRLRTTR